MPPESQQIDRVVHAFALRYSECNGEAVSFDEAYIIAFSLLILHTAIFNRHAHVFAPMSRADYVKVASASGTGHGVLECLYDNVVFTEFAYLREGDPLNHKSRALYDLITTGRVREMQSPRCAALDEAAPLAFTRGHHVSQLCTALAQSPVMEIRPVYRSARWRLSLYPTPAAAVHRVGFVCVSTVRRYEVDPAHNWRSLGRPRTYGVILTGSTLLWFKDASRMHVFMNAGASDDVFVLRPDENTPLDEALCVHSNSDSRAFLRVQQQWLALELKTTDTLDAWVTLINYIASLGSAGLRLDDAMQLAGGTAVNARVVQDVSLYDSFALKSARGAANAPLKIGQNVQVVLRCLSEQRARLTALESKQQCWLRYTRHLALQTPLQRSTRERFDAEMAHVSDVLRQTQFEIAYAACRVHMLEAQQQLWKNDLSQCGWELIQPLV